MTETAKPKPLWWRVGKGKWHEDPLTDHNGHPLSEEGLGRVLRGDSPLCSYCHRLQVYADRRSVQTRRTAPPVADQCKRCRAAKARKAKT